MNGIWKKYKVWLLIWFFYAVYWLLRSIQMLKSFSIQTERQTTQSYG